MLRGTDLAVDNFVSPSIVWYGVAFQNESKIGSRGKHGVTGYVRRDGYTHVGAGSEPGSAFSSQASIAGKPWKKHENRRKRDKLRRIHKDLDVHHF